MADKGAESSMLIVGMLILVLLTIGLTYYITKSSMPAVSPVYNLTNSTSTSQTPTITVSGDATETVTPDLMSIGLTVQTSGANASDSEVLNAEETAKVTAALLAAGVNKSDIQTQSYSTSPVYNQSCYDCVYAGAASSSGYSGVMIPAYPCDSKANCTITGYQTTNSILVNSEDTHAGGGYIDAAISSTNSTSVDYVYFSLQEKTRIQIESELQAEAAAGAKTKAANIAKGLGATLGKIVSVNPNEYPIYPVYAYENSAGAGATKSVPPTQISPTTTTMTSSVTVVYELVQ